MTIMVLQGAAREQEGGESAMRKVPDFTQIHLRVTDEQADESQMKMLFDTTGNKVFELLGLGSPDFEQRIFKAVGKHPKRYSRDFSLGLVTPETRHAHYFVTVSFLTVKSMLPDAYCFDGFRLGLEIRSNNGIVSRITSAIGRRFIAPPESGYLDEFVARTISSLNPEKPDLVRAYLHQGFKKALDEIQDEILSEIGEYLAKKDTHNFFNSALRHMKCWKALEAEAKRLRAKCADMSTRIVLLETAINSAVKEIAGTKSTIKSATLEGIRERLEAALNDGKSQEAERETAQETQETEEKS